MLRLLLPAYCRARRLDTGDVVLSPQAWYDIPVGRSLLARVARAGRNDTNVLLTQENACNVLSFYSVFEGEKLNLRIRRFVWPL